MRLTAATAALLSLIVLSSTGSVSASANTLSSELPLNKEPKISSVSILDILEILDKNEQTDKSEQQDTEKPEPPKIVVHAVADNETLYDIAEKYETTWERLYAKNLQIDDPHVIKVGVKITIPSATEELEERELPEPPAPEPKPVEPKAAAAPAPQYNTYSVSPGSSAGNLYTSGYCTWYVKNKRPDLPNNLGNADTWVERARAQGIPTGSEPRVGAVGQRAMHVVYVERINNDGTIYISEMNYRRLYEVTHRTVPADYFYYIY